MRRKADNIDQDLWESDIETVQSFANTMLPTAQQIKKRIKYNDRPTAISDMLADIMNYCAFVGEDFHEAMYRAQSHHRQEWADFSAARNRYSKAKWAALVKKAPKLKEIV